jgi:hypothetical protein
MATATDMVGELDDADKSSERDQYLNRRYRRAEAYEVLDGPISSKPHPSAVAGRGRQDLTNLPQPNSAPASVPGLFFSAAAQTDKARTWP